MTLPREIRDRVYDFVWDLKQTVWLSGWNPDYDPPSLRKIYPFPYVSANATLALLYVNHQISAEAMSVFYGKRKFCFRPDQLMPFLEGVALRRHLIKDIEVSEILSRQLPPQTFEYLRTLHGLRSFTVRMDIESVKEVQEVLVNAGIYKLTDLMKVTLHSRYGMHLGFREYDPLEYVIFTNIWTCAKGEREWISRGFHCQAHSREMNNKVCSIEGNDVASQLCQHDHHRLALRMGGL